MTESPNTPAAAGEGTPLWTKAKVEEWLSVHPAFGDPSYALVLASDIVYDYERELARLRADRDEAWDEARRYHTLMLDMEQELAGLRAAQLQEAQAWQPIHNEDAEILKQNIAVIASVYALGWAVCRLTPPSPPASAPKGFPAAPVVGDGGQNER